MGSCELPAEVEWLSESLLFLLPLVKYKDGLKYEAPRPNTCDNCGQIDKILHAHGDYSRKFAILQDGTIAELILWILRWLCPRCNRTQSTPPPNLQAYYKNSISIIVAIIWTCLNKPGGLYSNKFGFLQEAADERTIARYLERARNNAVFIQQLLREVIIENIEPRPIEELFKSGLSPPVFLRAKYRQNLETVATLWIGLAILFLGSKTLCIKPLILLAQAQNKAKMLNRKFII